MYYPFNESVSDSCTLGERERERLLLVEAKSPCDVSVGMLAVCTVALLAFARGIISVQPCVSWTNQPSQESLCLVRKHQISMRSRMCPFSLHKQTCSHKLIPTRQSSRPSQLITLIHLLNSFYYLMYCMHYMLTCFSEWQKAVFLRKINCSLNNWFS